jgi:nucleoside-diphosphate-sugar epimerase
VVADALDAEAVTAAVRQSKPDVIVHQLTALPSRLDYADPGVFKPTARLRRDGTRILVEAARAAGTRRLVAQSVAFMYAPTGDWVKTEDAPMMDPPPGPFGEIVEATRALERQVLGAEDIEGVVLRYGFFYGPGTSYARDGAQAQDARRRKLAIVGRGTGTFSFIHVDDAAAATVQALDHGSPGIYNVTDDDPAPMREWLPVFCAAVGAPKPLRVPRFLAKLVAGGAAVSFATDARGASNAKAKRELDWAPRYASWREGFQSGLD